MFSRKTSRHHQSLACGRQLGLLAHLDPGSGRPAPRSAQPQDVRHGVEAEEKGSIPTSRREDTRRVTIRAKLYAAIGDDDPGTGHHDRRRLRCVPVAERSLRRGRGALRPPGARAGAQVRGHRRQRLADGLRLRQRSAAGRSSSARRRTSGGCSPSRDRAPDRAARARDPRPAAQPPSTRFMGLDAVAYRALRAGQEGRVKQHLPRPRDPQLRGDGEPLPATSPPRRSDAATRCERASTSA